MLLGILFTFELSEIPPLLLLDILDCKDGLPGILFLLDTCLESGEAEPDEGVIEIEETDGRLVIDIVLVEHLVDVGTEDIVTADILEDEADVDEEEEEGGSFVIVTSGVGEHMLLVLGPDGEAGAGDFAGRG